MGASRDHGTSAERARRGQFIPWWQLCPLAAHLVILAAHLVLVADIHIGLYLSGRVVLGVPTLEISRAGVGGARTAWNEALRSRRAACKCRLFARRADPRLTPSVRAALSSLPPAVACSRELGAHCRVTPVDLLGPLGIDRPGLDQRTTRLGLARGCDLPIAAHGALPPASKVH